MRSVFNEVRPSRSSFRSTQKPSSFPVFFRGADFLTVSVPSPTRLCQFDLGAGGASPPPRAGCAHLQFRFSRGIARVAILSLIARALPSVLWGDFLWTGDSPWSVAVGGWFWLLAVALVDRVGSFF